jgi:hypothetical protein
MTAPTAPERPPTSAELDCLARVEGGLAWLARRLDRWHETPDLAAREGAATRDTVAGLLRDIRRTIT